MGRLPAGARNINLLIEDSSGSRYVLRGCRRNPHRDRIIFQLDFQDHLRRCGIPVPQVVASQTGERCVESSPVSLWVMSHFVAGHHYRYGSRVQLLHAARCLSGIHTAGADFTTRPVQDDTIPDLFKWWTHGDEEMAALRAMFAGAGVEPELDFLDHWRTALTRDNSARPSPPPVRHSPRSTAWPISPPRRSSRLPATSGASPTSTTTPATPAPLRSTPPAATRSRHPLSRRGNRQLDAAIHVIAVSQARDPGPGRDYYLRKIAEGRTPSEARRSLKRRVLTLSTQSGPAVAEATGPTVR